MKDKKEAKKVPVDYYEEARKSLISRMQSEDEDKINLKIKIATYVIYELSHSTPSWFKNYFLSDISKNMDETEINKNRKILKAENKFFNKIGNYLINMEAEIEYVNKILSPLHEEWDKKDFWRPIVADAFLLADLYFFTSTEASKKEYIKTEQDKNLTPGFFFQMLNESPAAL